VALIRRSRRGRTPAWPPTASPALATRLGSSKVTSMRSDSARLLQTQESASLVVDNSDVEHRYFPSREAFSADTRVTTQVTVSVDRG